MAPCTLKPLMPERRTCQVQGGVLVFSPIEHAPLVGLHTYYVSFPQHPAYSYFGAGTHTQTRTHASTNREILPLRPPFRSKSASLLANYLIP